MTFRTASTIITRLLIATILTACVLTIPGCQPSETPTPETTVTPEPTATTPATETTAEPTPTTEATPEKPEPTKEPEPEPTKEPEPEPEPVVYTSLGNQGLIIFEGKETATSDYNIYVMNPDGSFVTQLTSSIENDVCPVWSPDGSKIAYCNWQNDNYNIHVMNADGTGNKVLTTSASKDLYPAWSPDGKKLVFCSDRAGSLELYVMDAATGENVVMLTNDSGSKYHPDWSPDGGSILYCVSYSTTGYDIYRMNAQGGGFELVVSGVANQIFPRYSPQGDRFVMETYQTGEARFCTGSTANWSTEFHPTYRVENPNWTSDGKGIICSTFEQSGDTLKEVIALMNTDGTERNIIMSDMYSQGYPSQMPVPSLLPTYQVPEQIAATNVKWIHDIGYSGNDIAFTGRVSNSHPGYSLENVKVIARMLDQDGELLNEIQIQVGNGTLGPGESRTYSGKGEDDDNFRYYTLVLTYTWKTD